MSEKAYLCTERNEDMKHLYFIVYMVLLSMVPFVIVGCDKEKKIEEESGIRMESAILSEIKQRADLVTTEVKVRKLAIYDSSKHEKFEFTDLSTWKYGDRKCVIPVVVTIKYGYDLRDLSVDDVKLTDDSTAVVIFLPRPKVVDSGYEAKVEENNIVNMSSGMRDPISHEETNQLMEMAYKAVMKEDYTELIDRDIEHNAKTLFTSIVKGLGMQNVDVVIRRKEGRQ